MTNYYTKETSIGNKVCSCSPCLIRHLKWNRSQITKFINLELYMYIFFIGLLSLNEEIFPAIGVNLSFQTLMRLYFPNKNETEGGEGMVTLMRSYILGVGIEAAGSYL